MSLGWAAGHPADYERPDSGPIWEGWGPQRVDWTWESD